jgi:hypothetical protein
MMISRALLAGVLLAGLSSIAIAQTTTPTAPSTTTGTTAAMTETQIKDKLAKEGYTNVTLKEDLTGAATSGSSSPPAAGSTATTGAKTMMWTGTATKGGKQVNLTVDSAGKITEK